MLKLPEKNFTERHSHHYYTPDIFRIFVNNWLSKKMTQKVEISPLLEDIRKYFVY